MVKKHGFYRTAVLALCICGILGMATPARAEESPFFGGSGTKDDPYIITTAVHLKELADLVSEGRPVENPIGTFDGYFSEKYYRLGNDIDLSADSDWRPIGHNSNRLEPRFLTRGFDGGGHKITLKVTDGKGLFGYMNVFQRPGEPKADVPEIKNLDIEAVTASSSPSPFDTVGGLIGEMWGNIDKCNVTFTGDINITGRFGGLAGSVTGNITDCSVTFTGNINTASTYAGGLAGFVRGDITRCFVTGTGDITGRDRNGDFYGRIGGLAGQVNGNVTECRVDITGSVKGGTGVGGLLGSMWNTGNGTGLFRITDSYAEVDEVIGIIAGGLVGYIDTSSQRAVEVDRCYATAGVKASDARQMQSDAPFGIAAGIGGLIGAAINTDITNSHATGNVEEIDKEFSLSYAGGLVGSLKAGGIKDSYTTGSVTAEKVGNVGGLVGVYHFNSYSKVNTIENSHAAGDVRGRYGVGGLIGTIDAISWDGYSLNIKNSYATGDVTGLGNIGGIGGLIGYSHSGGENGKKIAISNCAASGNVRGVNTKDVGGLIGSIGSGTVSGSIASGNVEGVDQVGGLIGTTGSQAIITNSAATGNVKATESREYYGYAGGLVGKHFGSSNSVSNSYATGSVSSGRVAGGLTGQIGGGGVVTSSYAFGSATGVSAGGIYGEKYGSYAPVLRGNYRSEFFTVNGELIPKDNPDSVPGKIHGGVKTAAELLTKAEYEANGWTFGEGAWIWDDDASYPYPMLKVGSETYPKDYPFNFYPPTFYAITVRNDGNGTANASVGAAPEEAVITLTVEPNPGYRLKEWEVVAGGVTITNDRFTMPAAEVTVRAVFELLPDIEMYTVTLNQTEGGTAAAAFSGAPEGAEITLTAEPNSGYRFKEWEVVEGGVTITADSFIMPAADVTVRAVFEPLYTVTLNQAAGGTATVMPEAAAEGEEIALDASPNTNYSFVSWSVSPAVTWTTGNANSQSAAFTMPDGDVTVTPVYQYNGGTPGGETPGGGSGPSGPSTPSNPSNPSNPSDGGTVTLPGGTTVDVPTGTITAPDGTITLPAGKGATVVTSAGGTVEVPAGATIKPNGTITLPEGTSASAGIMEGAVSVAITGGMKVGRDGAITLTGGTGGTVAAPNAAIDVPAGTVIKPDGTITLPAGESASAEIVGGAVEVAITGGSGTTPGGMTVGPDGTITLTGDTQAEMTTPGTAITIPAGTSLKPDGTITLPEGQSGTAATQNREVEVSVSGGMRIDSAGEIEVSAATITTRSGVRITISGGWIVRGDGSFVTRRTGAEIVKPLADAAAEYLYVVVGASGAQITDADGSVRTATGDEIIRMNSDGSVDVLADPTPDPDPSDPTDPTDPTPSEDEGSGGGCSAGFGGMALALALAFFSRRRD